MNKTIVSVICSLAVVFGLTGTIQAAQTHTQQSQYDAVYNAGVNFTEKHPTLINISLKYIAIDYSSVYKRMDTYFATEGYKNISSKQIAQNSQTLLNFIKANKTLMIKVIDRVNRNHSDVYNMIVKTVSGDVFKIDFNGFKILNRIK